MAIIADIDKVDEVLLSDGWHIVVDKTFSIDVYEYIWKTEDGERTIWSSEEGGTLGFEFIELDTRDETSKHSLLGKLSDIKAVKQYK